MLHHEVCLIKEGPVVFTRSIVPNASSWGVSNEGPVVLTRSIVPNASSWGVSNKGRPSRVDTVNSPQCFIMQGQALAKQMNDHVIFIFKSRVFRWWRDVLIADPRRSWYTSSYGDTCILCTPQLILAPFGHLVGFVTGLKKWNDGVLGLFCAHCLG